MRKKTTKVQWVTQSRLKFKVSQNYRSSLPNPKGILPIILLPPLNHGSAGVKHQTVFRKTSGATRPTVPDSCKSFNENEERRACGWTLLGAEEQR